MRVSRAEPGCISHAVHIDCENPLRFVFVEQWAGKQALMAHFQVPASRICKGAAEYAVRTIDDSDLRRRTSANAIVVPIGVQT
jgi:quinol monooxygenase YgiN